MKYWIVVASKTHVLKGLNESFVQTCHGKKRPLENMSPGDLIIFYSPTFTFGKKDKLQHFTGVCKVTYNNIYSYKISEDFIPYRRNIRVINSQEVSINQLDLNFKTGNWGMKLRRGILEIDYRDAVSIMTAMQVDQSLVLLKLNAIGECC